MSEEREVNLVDWSPASMLEVTLNEPDDGLLAAIMVKLFADRQLSVSPEVIAYVITRIERTFDSARAIVGSLDREALSQRRPITIPLAREVLQQFNVIR